MAHSLIFFLTLYRNHAPMIPQIRRYSQAHNMARDGDVVENFKLIEFASRDGADHVIIHPALIELLEELRRDVGIIHVNSGYRTPIHNAKIGGVLGSYHVSGMAADITSRRKSPEDLYRIAETYSPGGLGLYPSFVHVDIGKSGRRWKQTDRRESS